VTLAKRGSWISFLFLAAVVYSTVFWLVPLLNTAKSPVVSWAAIVDLTVTVPLAFYWFVIRGAGYQWAAILPVILIGVRAAGLIHPIPALPWIAAPLELAVVLSLLRRRDSVRFRLLRSELEMFYFAFLSWGAKPDAPATAQSLSYTESSGATQLLPLLAFVLTIEATGVHLILHRWNPAAAWILTALEIYGLVWIAALWRSIYLRPILIEGGNLNFRLGYLFNAQIGRDGIAAWKSPAGSLDLYKSGLFRNVRMADPQFLIELRDPISMQGPFGIKRKISALALSVDDPARLAEWLQSVPPVALK
jgi:hypothetical protein